MTPVSSIWVYLSASPLLGLTLTLAIYVFAEALGKRLGSPAIANPVLISIVAIVVILQVTKTPYDRYFEGAKFVHFLLGPATVALACPAARQIPPGRDWAAA